VLVSLNDSEGQTEGDKQEVRRNRKTTSVSTAPHLASPARGEGLEDEVVFGRSSLAQYESVGDPRPVAAVVYSDARSRLDLLVGNDDRAILEPEAARLLGWFAIQ